jgi:hypothetical protein
MLYATVLQSFLKRGTAAMRIGKITSGYTVPPWRLQSVTSLRFQGNPASEVAVNPPTSHWRDTLRAMRPISRFKNGITSMIELFKPETYHPKKNLKHTLINTMVSTALLTLLSLPSGPCAIGVLLHAIPLGIAWQMFAAFYNGTTTPPEDFKAQREPYPLRDALTERSAS